MNPRYIQYAKAYGRTPEEQIAYDEEDWPGGSNIGFSLFIRTAWNLFDKQDPPTSETPLSRYDLFDLWLPQNLNKVRQIVDEANSKAREHWNKTATLQDKLKTVINICGYDLNVGDSTPFTLEGFNRHWEIPIGTYQIARSGVAGKLKTFSIRIDGTKGVITRL